MKLSAPSKPSSMKISFKSLASGNKPLEKWRLWTPTLLRWQQTPGHVPVCLVFVWHVHVFHFHWSAQKFGKNQRDSLVVKTSDEENYLRGNARKASTLITLQVVLHCSKLRSKTDEIKNFLLTNKEIINFSTLFYIFSLLHFIISMFYCFLINADNNC